MASYRAQTGLGIGQTFPGMPPPIAVHQGDLLPPEFSDDPANVNTIATLLAERAIAVADGPDDAHAVS
jgi:hypothetical protein